MNAKTSRLISLQQFSDDLVRKGFSKRNAEALIQCVYSISTKLEIRKKGKPLDRRFILRSDARLLEKSAREIGAFNLWRFLYYEHYSTSHKQFLKESNESEVTASRKNTRFLINNFVHSMEKISRIKLGLFRLMPNHSLEMEFMGNP